MLTYDLAMRGDQPIYVFIYQQIKADILKGLIRTGTKLPSKRVLADHLKISLITVENAYAQLVLEGYVETVEKKGYYVSRLSAMPAVIGSGDNSPPQGAAAATLSPDIDFSSNNICSGKFPFSVWARLLREVLSEKDARLLEAAPFNGAYELRLAIADYLRQFRGMQISPEQVIIGAGTEYLYSLIIQLLGRHSIYAIENPGYSKIAKVYTSNDVAYRSINLDDHGLSVTGLWASDANIVHISPSHHYPTGIVMPVGRRQEILKWASEREDRFIIEDDYDSEFRFAGRPVPTLQSIDSNQKVIYLNTFSKSIAPSIRISYMILPPPLLSRFRIGLGFYACTVSSFEQLTLAKFIAKGYFERHLNRMRNYYRKLRDQVINTIVNSAHGKKIKILEEDSGLHFLLKVSTRSSDRELVEKARLGGIRISCLSEYYREENQDDSRTIMINYSGLDYNLAAEAIRQLLEIIEEN